MITSETKKVYTVSGQEFTSLEEAQASALAEVLATIPAFAQDLHLAILEVARTLIPHADEIVDILTTRPGSLVRARKVNGGKKPRKAKAAQPAPDKLDTMLAGLGQGLVPNVPSVLPVVKGTQ